MGADDGEVRVEDFDPRAIYAELAVRTNVVPDDAGVSVQALFDYDGLQVSFRDAYGGSRSVRLVLAREQTVADSPETDKGRVGDKNLGVSEGNWLWRPS